MTSLKLNILLSIAVLSSLLFANLANAEGDTAWKTLKFSGIKQNEFVIHNDDQIDIFMNDSSSLLYRTVAKTEQKSTTLSWQWKIDQGFPATPLIDKEKDDRPVAVHIWFPRDKRDKGKGFKEFFGRLFGYDFPGRVITYVWGGTEQQGAIIENPHFEERGFLIVLKPGDFKSEGWITEHVNYKNDYQKIFGEDAPNPTHVAISGDSDHSHAVAMSSVQKVTFSDMLNPTTQPDLKAK